MYKVSKLNLRRFVKENKDDHRFVREFVADERKFEIEFKPTLTLNERSVFIRRVVDTCFDEAGNYRPEYFHPIVRATLLQMCLNIYPLEMKHEFDANGNPALDIDAMDSLFTILEDKLGEDDECLPFFNLYNDMLSECYEVVDWEKNRRLADHDTDSMIGNLLASIKTKVDSVDTESIGKLAEQLFNTAAGVNADTVLEKLIEKRHNEGEKSDAG